MMKDALRLLRSAKMIRWLLCPHHHVWLWFKAHVESRGSLLLVPLFPSEQPPGFTLLWWKRREGCHSWSCLVPLTEHFSFSVPYRSCGSPGVFCVLTFGPWASGREFKVTGLLHSHSNALSFRFHVIYYSSSSLWIQNEAFKIWSGMCSNECLDFMCALFP